MARLFPDRKAPGRNLVKDTLSSFKTHADCLIISFKAPCVQSKPKSRAAQVVAAELSGYAGRFRCFFGEHSLNSNSEVWTPPRPRRRPSFSMRRRFLQRKEPDCPAIILFRYSDCETSGFPRTRTTTSTRRSSSEFRLKQTLRVCLRTGFKNR